MVAKKSLTHQLSSIGYRFRLFGRTEIEQLRHLLEPGETVVQCVYGYYQGGSGLLVATDRRVLLIDKRPFYLYIEDHNYEIVTHVDFASRMLEGVLYFQAGMKRFVFRSVSDARLSKLCEYIQEKITTTERKIRSTPTRMSTQFKPYLNPAWTPHHLTFLPRQRPAKFYANTTAKTYL
jgi:hypothetical protein